jgi:hypothetical protein
MSKNIKSKDNVIIMWHTFIKLEAGFRPVWKYYISRFVSNKSPYKQIGVDKFRGVLN